MRFLILVIFVIACESEHGSMYSSDYEPTPNYNDSIYGEWINTEIPKTFFFNYGKGTEITKDTTYEITFTVDYREIKYIRGNDSITMEYSVIDDSTMDLVIDDTISTFYRTVKTNPDLFKKWITDSIGDTTDFGLGDTLEFLKEIQYYKFGEIEYRYNITTEHTSDSLIFYSEINKSNINVKSYDFRIMKIIENKYVYQIDSVGLLLQLGSIYENKFKLYKEVK